MYLQTPFYTGPLLPERRNRSFARSRVPQHVPNGGGFPRIGCLLALFLWGFGLVRRFFPILWRRSGERRTCRCSDRQSTVEFVFGSRAAPVLSDRKEGQRLFGAATLRCVLRS